MRELNKGISKSTPSCQAETIRLHEEEQAAVKLMEAASFGLPQGLPSQAEQDAMNQRGNRAIALMEATS